MRRCKRLHALAVAGTVAFSGLLAGGHSAGAAELAARLPGASVVASGQVNVAAGQRVTFQATATGEIVRYVWDLGDGTFLMGGASITHSYSTPGTYRVRVNTVNASTQDEFATITVIVRTGSDSRFATQGSADDRRESRPGPGGPDGGLVGDGDGTPTELSVGDPNAPVPSMTENGGIPRP